jgi:hypothetical protein
MVHPIRKARPVRWEQDSVDSERMGPSENSAATSIAILAYAQDTPRIRPMYDRVHPNHRASAFLSTIIVLGFGRTRIILGDQHQTACPPVGRTDARRPWTSHAVIAYSITYNPDAPTDEEASEAARLACSFANRISAYWCGGHASQSAFEVK